MGCAHCLFGLQKVIGEPFQHVLLQQEFIHGERSALSKRGCFLIVAGSRTFGVSAAAR
jgi:hypothetical protein